MLRPGEELVAKMGGLHKFMSWDKPILTDSGGFQMFSLAEGEARGAHKNNGVGENLVKIDEQGVTFKSYLDGSVHRVTPERAMDIQMKLGADFIMAFDQCPKGGAPKGDVVAAMQRTSRWLVRCQESMNKPSSRLLGIIQGGTHDDLRIEHAQEICQHPLFGFAVGGLSVGEPKEDMWRALLVTTPHMPKNKPRYLMGVGTPDDLLDGIHLGIDMFDCVMPTRNARNATLFTHSGKVSIKSAAFKDDPGPLDDRCNCYTCRTFSRAYLRHLYVSQELLFFRLASLHNIAYYLQLMEDARLAILEKRFANFRRERKEAHNHQIF
jgi:queuine tRNA-ribosyltransferase